MWVALGLSMLGSLLLAFPAPFLTMSQATPEVAGKARAYLLVLAFSLPASLMSTQRAKSVPPADLQHRVRSSVQRCSSPLLTSPG